MPKKIFYKSIYNDSDYIDYIEEAIGYVESAMEEIEEFEECKDIYVSMQDIIKELQEMQAKLDEMRINEWADEQKQSDREFLSSRGIEGLII